MRLKPAANTRRSEKITCDTSLIEKLSKKTRYDIRHSGAFMIQKQWEESLIQSGECGAIKILVGLLFGFLTLNT